MRASHINDRLINESFGHLAHVIIHHMRCLGHKLAGVLYGYYCKQLFCSIILYSLLFCLLFDIDTHEVDFRGFNDAVNGFADDGWSLMGSDGVEDVTVVINSSPAKLLGSYVNTSAMVSTLGGGVLCAKASMLLQVYF